VAPRRASKGPSERTIKRLFALSGNRCAFPRCQTALIQGDTVVGQVCHIKAANPGGSRYDAQQTNAERHSFENLILMCGTHHTVIDAAKKPTPSSVSLSSKPSMKKALCRLTTALPSVGSASDQPHGRVRQSVGWNRGAYSQCEHDQCSSIVNPNTWRRGARLDDPRTVLLSAAEPQPQWAHGTLG
jgi:hypothetical protein